MFRDRAPARAINAIVVSARLVAGPNKQGGRGGRTLARGSRDFPCETRRRGEGPDDARPATSERTQAPRFETARAPARRVRTPPGRPDDAQANTNRNVRARRAPARIGGELARRASRPPPRRPRRHSRARRGQLAVKAFIEGTAAPGAWDRAAVAGSDLRTLRGKLSRPPPPACGCRSALCC